MKKSTLFNCKEWEVSNGTCSISKRLATLIVMMVMIGSKALAGASFEVIGGLRYLIDSDTKTATLMANTETVYSGDIVVPESVKAKDGNVYKITAFGEKCFYGCTDLTSIKIPSSVTSLGQGCFQYCTKLTSITIPSSVNSLGDQCFSDCRKITSIKIPSSITSLSKGCFGDCSGLTSIEIPSSVTSIELGCFMECSKLESFYFKGGLPTTLSEALIPTTCIIYVPTEYLQDYKDALGADYKYVYTWNPNGSGDGDKPVTKCATPTVSYESGELKFACETAGAKYHYTISDKDMATDAYSENGKVALSAAYEISVYATADGYSASEKAQATLYWLNANLKDATNINMAKTRGVVASAHDGIVSISGLDNGEVVKFYAADGKFIGHAVAANGTASYAVSEALVIAKVGNNSIKIAMK